MKAFGFILAVLATVFVLGCGGDTTTSPTATQLPTTTAGATGSPVPTTTPLPTATPTLELTPTAVASPTPTATPNPTSTATPTQAPKTLTLGDSATANDVTFTVHGARWGTSSFATPEPGRGWLMIDVGIQNNRSESYFVSSFLMFKLVDSEGRSQDSTVYAEPNGTLDGELGAGRTIMRGELGYDVGDGQGPWELIIAPEVFESGQVVFVIPPP